MTVEELLALLRQMRVEDRYRAAATELIHRVDRFSYGTDVDLTAFDDDVVAALRRPAVATMVDGVVVVAPE